MKERGNKCISRKYTAFKDLAIAQNTSLIGETSLRDRSAARWLKKGYGQTRGVGRVGPSSLVHNELGTLSRSTVGIFLIVP